MDDDKEVLTMAIKTKEEILSTLRERIGEETDDDSLSFLEDISDTFDDLETKAKGDGVNWKEKYEENDKNWRNKYKERFFEKPANDTPPEDEPEGDVEEPKTFEDLFKKE